MTDPMCSFRKIVAGAAPASQYEPGQEPRAIIEQLGRLVWGVHIVFTLTGGLPVSWGPDGDDALVLGRRWARWKARRMLAAYLRQDQYPRNREEIRG